LVEVIGQSSGEGRDEFVAAIVSLLDLIGVLGLEDCGTILAGGIPVVHGPAGIRAAAMRRKGAASGQAAAKARRTPEAVSMTRVPSALRALLFG
jgi:hypothetical protein